MPLTPRKLATNEADRSRRGQVTLTAWCVKQYGGRERYNDKGDFIAIVPVSEKLRMGMATMELKMAAHRIIA